MKLTLLSLIIAASVLPQPRGGRGPGIQPLTDETGFQQIFDGNTLTGWDGDPKLWRVAAGVIVGETTPETKLERNSFLVWRAGTPADFELKLDYRMTGGNSGIQYRSVELPDAKWALKGYQADIDAQQRYTGQIYEERGRGFLAMRGQLNWIGEGKRPGIVGTLGDPEEMKSIIKSDDWNSFHVIARGPYIVQFVNGRVMSALIDDDTANRKMDGLIGIQLHVGPPMKMEVRNVRLKKL